MPSTRHDAGRILRATSFRTGIVSCVWISSSLLPCRLSTCHGSGYALNSTPALQKAMQTSYTAIFESNSATCICDHCSFLQPRDDKVVDSVKKHAQHPMCACLQSMDSTRYSLYRYGTTGTPTSSVALEIVNVVCRLKVRDKALG